MAAAYATAAALLEAVTAALVSADRPVPERSYVADGPQNMVAIDCEQLVVGIGPVVPGIPGAQIAVGQLRTGDPFTLTLGVDLARPAPMVQEGLPPDPDDIEDSAQGIYADVDALAMAARAFSPPCNPIANLSIVLVGPQGGFVRAVMVLTTGLFAARASG